MELSCIMDLAVLWDALTTVVSMMAEDAILGASMVVVSMIIEAVCWVALMVTECITPEARS